MGRGWGALGTRRRITRPQGWRARSASDTSRRGRVTPGNRRAAAPGRCRPRSVDGVSFFSVTPSAGPSLSYARAIFIALIIVGYCRHCVVVARNRRRTINILAFDIPRAARHEVRAVCTCPVHRRSTWHWIANYYVFVVFTTVTDDGTQKSYFAVAARVPPRR